MKATRLTLHLPTCLSVKDAAMKLISQINHLLNGSNVLIVYSRVWRKAILSVVLQVSSLRSVPHVQCLAICTLCTTPAVVLSRVLSNNSSNISIPKRGRKTALRAGPRHESPRTVHTPSCCGIDLIVYRALVSKTSKLMFAQWFLNAETPGLDVFDVYWLKLIW